MKKLFLAACLLISISTMEAQVKFDALEFTPQQPKAGQMVSFKYNTRLSSLIDQKKVDIAIYLFSKKGLKILEPKILQTGNVYSGNFKLDSNTACIAFGFSANDKKEKDNNAGDGYIVPVYSKSNQPVTDYYVWAGRLYNGYGENLFGMRTDAEKNLSLLQEGLRLNPGVKNDNLYFGTYLSAVNSVKKKDGEPVILQYLKEIESKPGITESDYGLLTQWYTRLKMKPVADSFSTIMKEKFPDGIWKKNEMTNAISKAKDAESKKNSL